MMFRPAIRRRLWRTAVILGLLCLSGCQLPRDPEGTLQRIRGGSIRVGVVHHPPWTQTQPGWEPAGIEVALLQQIARSLDADIVWVSGSESELLRALESFELDAVIGGIPEQTPWRERVALSQPYDARSPAVRAGGPAHVFALPPGENAWLLLVDRWLQDHRARIAESLTQAPPW